MDPAPPVTRITFPFRKAFASIVSIGTTLRSKRSSTFISQELGVFAIHGVFLLRLKNIIDNNELQRILSNGKTRTAESNCTAIAVLKPIIIVSTHRVIDM